MDAGYGKHCGRSWPIWAEQIDLGKNKLEKNEFFRPNRPISTKMLTVTNIPWLEPTVLPPLWSRTDRSTSRYGVER